MGFWTDMSDAISGRAKGMQKIEHICSQLGWGIDARVGKGIILDFSTKDGKRRLLISTSESGEVGVASAFSEAKFYPRNLPGEFGYLLLHRNKERAMGGWELMDDEGKVGFAFSHTFFVGGLTPDLFKAMCTAMAAEVGEVDKGLRDKGII